jgi:uncharacterized Tic20 family protein
MTRSNTPIEICRYAMWCHLINLSWLVLFFAFWIAILKINDIYFAVAALVVLPPICLFVSRISCLVFWRMHRRRHPFVDESGKAALNFSLSIDLYLFVVGTISLATCGLLGLGSGLGVIAYLWILMPLLLFAHFCSIVFGGIQASKGIIYKYPGTISFFK